MKNQNSIIIYLSRGPDKERSQILERNELYLGGHHYALSPTYLHTNPLGLVKKLVELRMDVPKNIDIEVERDKKFEGINKGTYRFVIESCVRLMGAYKE